MTVTSVSRQLHRVAETARPTVAITVDGQAVEALAGDTVLTAVLANARRLRDNEFDGKPRAGFCLMGACQECWLWRPDGRRLRACTTLVEPGLALATNPPLAPWQARGS
ncbi:MAG: (2Fe-2S)-binding protein [Alphaproteobacteria bacterium]